MSWSLVGQALSALLGLLLVKLSVNLFSVSAFGGAVLLLGLQSLARNAALNPLLNLAIYQYPQALQQHGAGWLYRTTVRALASLSVGVLPIFGALIWALDIPSHNLMAATALLAGLLLSEAIKAARLNLLHSEDRSRAYALWTVADAASKPLALYLVGRLLLDFGALGLLACHLIGSLLLLLATGLAPHIRALCHRAPGLPRLPSPPELARQHWAFLLPLAGLGLMGWFTGLSDRYLVNLHLGPGTAGLYAGLYGIFSMPFIMTSTALVLATRPRLLAMEAEGKAWQWQRAHWAYLRLLALLLVLLAALLYLAKAPLVRLTLSPPFQAALSVVPGILLGNAIMALGTYLEVGLYLRKRTDLALIKQATGAVAAVFLVLLLLPRWGLGGAAWACPLYASIEFLVGACLLQRLHRQGHSV